MDVLSHVPELVAHKRLHPHHVVDVGYRHIEADDLSPLPLSKQAGSFSAFSNQVSIDDEGTDESGRTDVANTVKSSQPSPYGRRRNSSSSNNNDDNSEEIVPANTEVSEGPGDGVTEVVKRGNEPDETTSNVDSCCCCRRGRKSRCCEDEGRWCRSCGTALCEFGRELVDIVGELKIKQRTQGICTVDTLKNKVPIVKWLPQYTLKKLQCDIIAGITVGLTVIPQGIAYAQVAGLEAQYGLYSAFLGNFIYAILGSSKDITVGPTAVMSLLVGTLAVSPVTGNATYATLVSLIGGCVQVFMSIFRLGFIVNYISHPLIQSFTTASAVTIIEGQIKKWFGIKNIPRDFVHEAIGTLQNIPKSRLWDFLMGFVCLVLLRILKEVKTIKLTRMKPSRTKRALVYSLWLTGTARNAIVVLLAGGLAAILQSYSLRPFSASNTLPPGLPPFRPPNLTLTVPSTNQTYSTNRIFTDIGPGFVIIPLIALLETIAIGKFFANAHGYRVDPDQELLALGVANVLGSFVGAYMVTGSFSRSAINAQSGVKTPLGCIFTGVLVILALLFLTPYFNYIPDAALAAIIISSAADLFNFGLVVKIWRINKAEVFPWLLTFVCGLGLGVEYGIMIGIGWSMLTLVYPWGWPSVKVVSNEPLGIDDGTEQAVDKRLIVLSISHGSLFPGVETLKDKIRLKGGALNWVILDFTLVTYIDFTTIEGFSSLMNDFHKAKTMLYITNIKPHVMNTFERAKLKNFHYASTVAEAELLIRAAASSLSTRVELDDTTESEPSVVDPDIDPTVTREIE